MRSFEPMLAAATVAHDSSAVAIAARTVAIAGAIGLDVFALSAGIGIAGVPWALRWRLGAAFAAAEILMQVIGTVIGASAGHVFGEVAAYVGFAALGGIGISMWRESCGEDERTFSERAMSGWGLVAACASISLDSLGVGFTLPSLGVPLPSLFAAVACSTIGFTLGGLAFGERVGKRFQKVAERGAGLVLIALALLFTLEHLLRGGGS